MTGTPRPAPDTLAARIRRWGRELGFQRIGFADTELAAAERAHFAWLARGYHGEMAYMARHGTKRTRPAELVPGTRTVISAAMNYWLGPELQGEEILTQPERAFISRYALGRDYHKVVRKRLARLARRIEEEIGPFGYRVFCDSAPVLEKPLAVKAGLGWQGKHSNLIDREHGSWFFLGEIYTDLALPVDRPQSDHCGTCTACIQACPTGAIVAPGVVDARRCISYLTIELHGPIPEPLRPLLGNRIYGCDDCQLVCPWNRFARPTTETDFLPRHGLEAPRLVDLFAWDEQTFLKKTEGSAIRRLGHERWLRNIAVALGNAPPSTEITAVLERRTSHPSALVREHVAWALARQRARLIPATGAGT
ncbi:MAG: tRNA epoxyqueuosine(34) reductase QueG [Gammaproteobacteria bacterium]|nr:MAG: tRNA epoxyqueuosine(34) reductase QueG [Gammaproteobacteria bacterium]